MGDICMRAVTNAVSFISMIFGFLVNLLAKYTHIIDDSITTFAGIVGLVGAGIWVSIAVTTRKKGKVAFENEKLDNKIKRKQLENLENSQI
jgi:hypothetical protein